MYDSYLVPVTQRPVTKTRIIRRSRNLSSVPMLVFALSLTAARLTASGRMQIDSSLPLHPQAIGRRQIAISLPFASSWLAALPSHASQDLTREEAVQRLLGSVPAYVVTNAAAQPYLTDLDGAGRRGGSVFMGPRDAADVLRQVRVYDPAAQLAVLPLSTVYLQVAKTATDAASARAEVAEPKESTSSDMRLFQLRPLKDEQQEEASISMLPGGSLLPGINLYYEPSLFLGSEAAPQRPYFLRVADLNTAWRRGNGDERNRGQVSPTLRVINLEVLLGKFGSGSLDALPILMPPSETAELDYKASTNQ